jgi:succinate-semialdehyde dehydrogenase/glutarate-semialdehyde dehydrogenase
MATRKLAPALAAGCTVVLKPTELTPLTSLLFAELLVEVGLPPGVVNVVTTTRPAEVSAALLADPRLRKLSFTGSTAVGRTLLTQAAPRVLHTSMELGGNAPFVRRRPRGAEDRRARAACRRAGRAGPRGRAPGRRTRSLRRATVLADVAPDADILAEEIFGPVVVLTSFTDERHAVELANATEYGLASYVYTRDVSRAHRMIDALDAGMTGINTGLISNAAAPFGGVKQSGTGREGGTEGAAGVPRDQIRRVRRADGCGDDSIAFGARRGGQRCRPCTRTIQRSAPGSWWPSSQPGHRRSVRTPGCGPA